MPSLHPSLQIHVWLNLSYQSLLTAALNSFALWKRGIRSIMWPGKVFGTLYYLLCKQVMGCKSTFGPGCILIKCYQDLENQTGCSFSITAEWKVDTDSSKRSVKDNWSLTLHFLKSQRIGFTLTLCHTQLWPEELFWNPPTYLWSSHCIFHLHIYIYINAHEVKSMTEQYCPCTFTFFYLPVVYRNCILTVSQKYDLHICNSSRTIILTLIYKTYL